MKLKANDLSIEESGYYQHNKRIGDMKDDNVYKNFTRE